MLCSRLTFLHARLQVPDYFIGIKGMGLACRALALAKENEGVGLKLAALPDINIKGPRIAVRIVWKSLMTERIMATKRRLKPGRCISAADVGILLNNQKVVEPVFQRQLCRPIEQKSLNLFSWRRLIAVEDHPKAVREVARFV